VDCNIAGLELNQRVSVDRVLLLISPTLHRIVILKESILNRPWCFHVKGNENQKGVFCYLNEKFRRLWSLPEMGKFNSF
jgi:ribosomal protein L19